MCISTRYLSLNNANTYDRNVCARALEIELNRRNVQRMYMRLNGRSTWSSETYRRNHSENKIDYSLWSNYCEYSEHQDSYVYPKKILYPIIRNNYTYYHIIHIIIE